MNSLLTDYMVDEVYQTEEVDSAKKRAAARRAVTATISSGKKLAYLRDTHGDGIFSFLPENTPRTVRACPFDTFDLCIRLLHRCDPTIPIACNLVVDAINRDPYKPTLEAIAPDVFEQRVRHIIETS